jgi:hypothetical protein
MRITGVELTDQEASDILTIAVEGDITPQWAYCFNINRSNGTDGLSDLSIWSVDIADAVAEDGEGAFSDRTVDLDTIKDGLNKILSGGSGLGLSAESWLVGEIQAALENDLDFDAATADAVLQAGALGELMFG